MINYLDKKTKDVIEFREMMGLPVATGMPFEEYKLAFATVAEEFIELMHADNLVDKVDALVDTVYTVIGMAVNKDGKFWIDSSDSASLWLVLGLISKAVESLRIDFDRCWDEVHRSNMSKACKDGKEVVLTQSHYEAKGVTVYVENINGLYVVKCLDDKSGIMRRGKALKSVNYSKADLEKFI